MDTTDTTTVHPLPHEVPNGDVFFAKGYESLNAFHAEYPRLPGYPVRCTEGVGILMAIHPIHDTRPQQYVGDIDLGNDKGWTTNMGFVRHYSWGKDGDKPGFSLPPIAALGEFSLRLLGNVGEPLRDSYEGLLAKQATVSND